MNFVFVFSGNKTCKMLIIDGQDDRKEIILQQ